MVVHHGGIIPQELVKSRVNLSEITNTTHFKDLGRSYHNIVTTELSLVCPMDVSLENKSL